MKYTIKNSPSNSINNIFYWINESKLGYRYRFNGQEQDNEISGTGNIMTAEFWEYDTRLGRRFNLDPVVKVFESPYSTFSNNPIWFIDIKGNDTTVVGAVSAQSAIRDVPSNPSFVPPGTKLQSLATFSAKIQDGKFTMVDVNVYPTEFESPVLWGIKPEFTSVTNKTFRITENGQKAYIHYTVQTELSSLEVMGQWANTLLSGTVQDNVITVTQSVDIEIDMNSIRTTFDGSTFPETQYNAAYIVNTGVERKTGKISMTLKQSSYEEAVKAKTFNERNHPQKFTKKLTY